MTANGYGVFLWGDETVLELEIGDGCATLGMYYMPFCCVLYNGEF